MKATCNREGLLTAFQIASSVVPTRTPKAILKSVKLDLDPEKSILSATDLSLGIKYAVSGITVEEPGQVVLPSASVNSILRELPDETVVLESTDSGVRLSGASSKFDLAAEDPLQFPSIPEIPGTGGPSINVGVFSKMIRRTVFAVASENSRFALNSVLLEFSEDSSAKLVATDGKRLALMPGPAMLGEDGVPSGVHLLPPRLLQLLQRTLLDPEENVHITLGDNEVLFKTGKVTLYTRLVEGRFPRYQDVFPPEPQYRIPLVVGNLFTVVRQAKIVTNVSSKGVLFSFNDGVLTVASRSMELGESEIRMPVSYQGDPIEITFDPNFLAEALKVLDADEEVSLEIVDERRAAVLRCKDSYEYVIMPLTKERDRRPARQEAADE